MHLKRNTVKKNGKVYEYAKIVQSVRREDGQVTQKVIKNLGRMKTEEDWKRAKSILEAMKKGEKIVKLKDVKIEKQLELGGIWAADNIWTKVGVGKAVRNSFAKRDFKYNIERMAFLLTVNRLYDPGSDLATYKWINKKAYCQLEPKEQWVYRTGYRLAGQKGEIEEEIFQNLKKNLNLSPNRVFYDLTSSYFEGDGPELALFGYSRDHRPDRKQIVLGVVMVDEIPITHQVWAGNTADKSTLERSVKDLKERFGIEDMAFVADRGVMSSTNLGELEDWGYDYILSTNRRKNEKAEELLVKDVSGADEVRAREVYSEGERRYILCLNEERREKDLEKLKMVREECEKELEELRKKIENSQEGRGRPMTKESTIKQAQNILGKNKRLFDIEFDETLEWELNEEAWQHEKDITGKILLVSTDNLKPSKTLDEYKNLKDVEQAFDDLKNFLKLRPFHHNTDKGVRGHIFICILALLLKKLMEKRTEKSFKKIMNELEPMKANILNVGGEKICQRNEITHSQEKIFESLDVETPPRMLVETKK
ncbi:IS1634 family transposase [archaeon SCG-AAA382B04]|nr:IS1634 family transposase [archaeon SCG-AAA382B04]